MPHLQRTEINNIGEISTFFNVEEITTRLMTSTMTLETVTATAPITTTAAETKFQQQITKEWSRLFPPRL